MSPSVNRHPPTRVDGRRPAGRRTSLVKYHDRQHLSVSHKRHLSDISFPPGILGALFAVSFAAVILGILLLVFIAGWVFAADRSAVSSVLGTAIYSWLMAQGMPLLINAEWFYLLPIGLTVAFSWILVTATRMIARRQGIDTHKAVRQFLLTSTTTYLLVTVGLSLLATTATVQPLWWAAPIAALWFACFTGWAFISHLDAGKRLRAAIAPGVLMDVAVVWRWVKYLLVAGTTLFVLSWVLSIGIAWEMLSSLTPGITGTIGIVVISLVYLPTAILWSSSYLLGSGVVFADTWISPVSADTVIPPAFPLAAGLPSSYSVGFTAILLIPAVVAIWVIRTDGRSEGWGLRWWGIRARQGLIAGLICGLLSFLAWGTLGGTVGMIGPLPPLVAAVSFVWWMAAAMIYELWRTWRRRSVTRTRKTPPSVSAVQENT